MIDLIGYIVQNGADASRRSDVEATVVAYSADISASRNRGDRNLVAVAEQIVQADPAGAFEFDSYGSASLKVAGTSFHADRFETASIAELKTRVRMTPGGRSSSRLRLWVLDGATAATDIGGLQATSGPGTLFQVASQFNCLESPGAYMTPVQEYFGDPTQGPRASISAFPGTLLRHYSAPAGDGTRFVQTEDGPQIELLADACGPGAAPHGYFTGENHANTETLVGAIEERFESIRVGVHADVQVVLGLNWDGGVEDSNNRRIAQVFTSTAAGGMYGAKAVLGESRFNIACRQLLRAAYLGTLLSAIALGKPRVLLTLIGGGVFGNPIRLIWDSILWAMDDVEPLLRTDIDVIVNGYNLGRQINLREIILPDVNARGGAVFEFLPSGNVAILS